MMRKFHALVASVAVTVAAMAMVLPADTPGDALPDTQAVSAQTEDDTDGPLRIMVEGDSLSQGFSGDTTWRYWVAQEFARQGVPVDFVGPHHGSSQGPVNPFGGRYARAFDSEHAARVGSQLYGKEHLGSITARMQEFSPDIVVLMIGYNDLRRGGKTARQVSDGVREFVARVRAVSPDTKVVIGKLMNALDRFHKRRPMANKAYNNQITEFAAGKPRILIAQTDVGWRPRKWTTDGVHPNPTGETVLAQRFAMALHRAGALPGQPALIQQRPWRPRITTNAVGRRGGLTVSWPDQKITWTITRFIVQVARVGGSGQRRAFTREESHTVNGLPAGTYTVRTIPVRKQMQGAPTAPVRVRVLPARAASGAMTGAESAAVAGAATGAVSDARA